MGDFAVKDLINPKPVQTKVAIYKDIWIDRVNTVRYRAIHSGIATRSASGGVTQLQGGKPAQRLQIARFLPPLQVQCTYGTPVVYGNLCYLC